MTLGRSRSALHASALALWVILLSHMGHLHEHSQVKVVKLA